MISTTEKSEIVIDPLDMTTLERIEKTRKEGEALSDIISRLSETKLTALQQRGERVIKTSE